eukprot:jgi/Psemu1/316372/fgenesh1_kg.3253_\
MSACMPYNPRIGPDHADCRHTFGLSPSKQRASPLQRMLQRYCAWQVDKESNQSMIGLDWIGYCFLFEVWFGLDNIRIVPCGYRDELPICSMTHPRFMDGLHSWIPIPIPSS